MGAFFPHRLIAMAVVFTTMASGEYIFNTHVNISRETWYINGALPNVTAWCSALCERTQCIAYQCNDGTGIQQFHPVHWLDHIEVLAVPGEGAWIRLPDGPAALKIKQETGIEQARHALNALKDACFPSSPVDVFAYYDNETLVKNPVKNHVFSEYLSLGGGEREKHFLSTMDNESAAHRCAKDCNEQGCLAFLPMPMDKYCMRIHNEAQISVNSTKGSGAYIRLPPNKDEAEKILGLHGVEQATAALAALKRPCVATTTTTIAPTTPTPTPKLPEGLTALSRSEYGDDVFYVKEESEKERKPYGVTNTGEIGRIIPIWSALPLDCDCLLKLTRHQQKDSIWRISLAPLVTPQQTLDTFRGINRVLGYASGSPGCCGAQRPVYEHSKADQDTTKYDYNSTKASTGWNSSDEPVFFVW